MTWARAAARVPYPGRPGPSPVLASYLAAGLLQRGDRVLDLGCGTGADAIALARWGCRVTAVDRDRWALGIARRRAARAGVRVRFVEADALSLQPSLKPSSFDAVWDGLLLNNLRASEEPDYAGSVAHVVRPGGLLLLELRVTKRSYDAEATEAASPALRRWFTFGPSAATLIPEHPDRPGGPPFARVVVQVGTRNGRRAG
jgi:ubiquinone/menaquinone biosynthesis C-methylase UbiE